MGGGDPDPDGPADPLPGPGDAVSPGRAGLAEATPAGVADGFVETDGGAVTDPQAAATSTTAARIGSDRTRRCPTGIPVGARFTP